MTGYIRQSDAQIEDGETIFAADLDAEFDALQTAFHQTNGHAHDGTSGNAPKIVLTGAAAVTGTLPVFNGGTAATTASAARTNLGLAIGTNVQAYDAGLASIAGLTTAADTMIYTTALDTYTTTPLTSFARTILDDANASTALSTLGFSTYGKTLIDDADASAALTTLGFSAYGKTLIDDATAGDALTTLGVSTYAKTLLDDTDASTALSTLGFSTYGKTLIDDATAGDALTTLGVSTYAKTILDDADAAAARTTLGLGTLATLNTINGLNWSGADLDLVNGGTGASNGAGARVNLGLVIGTDVQAFDAGLQSIAGLTTTADRMIYTTASDTYAVTPLTSFARTLLDDADAATARTTLGVSAGLGTADLMYAGTDGSNLEFPVTSYLITLSSAHPGRNQQGTVYLSANAAQFSYTATANPINGTWSAKGASSSSVGLVQRVS